MRVNRKRWLQNRRAFVKNAAITTTVTALGSVAFGAESRKRARVKIPAAIIGHTGKGDYGHGLDLIFNDRAQIEVVGIADPVASGRSAAATRCKALHQYDDYRVMLEKE